ncbi:MAG: tRNA glutamyl-Q(34) synthetase GluQRS [Oscillibacter sp.]|nr:tRNA glutamyl-Q(34) synthetase GluQRS [Oscillibacter sp.]
MEVRGRFAPSPSGELHAGNLFCALLAFLSARSQGGTFLLRIEDLDTARCKREYAEQAIRDLSWLGFSWDGEVLWQSERTEVYRAALEVLREKGLVYPCFCTRAALHAVDAPHGRDGQSVYSGACRNLSAQEIARRSKTRAPSLRVRVPDETWGVDDGHMGRYEENLARECGDFLLRRSDGLFAYQLAVVTDDAASGVTEVVRGADLLSSAPRQNYLYSLFGWAPPRYFHVPLLLNAEGKRLSKRDADAGASHWRGRFSPQEILGKLAYLAGQNPTMEAREIDDLVAAFDPAAVPREDVRIPRGFFG